MRGGLRVYYYFIFGAFGGLTGWFLAALLSPDIGGGSLAHGAAYGALLGAPICGAISAYDGMVSLSFGRLIKFIFLGVILGTLAGVIAIPVTQVVYNSLLAPRVESGATASALVGILCWIIFGGLVGLGEGLSKGTQVYKGLLGGGLGGLMGGLIYEIARASNGAGTAPYMQQRLLGLSISLLGGFIGMSIAFMTSNIRHAWLEILTGKAAGLVYDVTKYVDYNRGTTEAGLIGSDELRTNIYLTADQGVSPLHAKIGHANGKPTLTVIHGEHTVDTILVNGRRTTTAPLKDGDRIQIGAAMLIYRNKYK